MFRLFKRIPRSNHLVFDHLNKYAHKDRYFYRTKQWCWLTSDKEITVFSPPRFITMDPWPQQVFLDARGDKTVSGYIHFVASKFTSEMPPRLDELIILELEKLMKEELVALSNTPKILEDKYLLPTRK